MATVIWRGQQQKRAKVVTITVTGALDTTTYTITIQYNATNIRSITYTALSTDTTADIIAALLAIVTSSSAPGEFAEFSYSTTATTFVITGPSDGAPFTIATGVAGGGTLSATVTTTPLSPHDANDVTNYSGGALPSATDTLVFEDSDIDVKYNMTALASIALTKLIRRATYTGTIGLPLQADGFIQYRELDLSVNAATIEWEGSTDDDAGQFQLVSTASSAVTLQVIGGGAPQVGQEPLLVYGLYAASTVRVINSGLSVARRTGTTSGALATVTAVDSSLSFGSGQGTITAATLSNSSANIQATITTFTMDAGGTVAFRGSAAVTTFTMQAGGVSWQSTGSPGAITLGSDAVFDAALAPAAFAVTSVAIVGDNAALNDPNKRMTRAFTITLTNTSLNAIRLNTGTSGTVVISA